MSADGNRSAMSAPPRRHIEYDLLLSALPHPILVLAEDDRILYANAAAETFFSQSLAMMRRQTLAELIAFSSPLSALVAQVRRSGQTVNEYGVDMELPRNNNAHKLVDVFGGPLPDQPGLILLMLQQRSMAQMIERQLTHRAAARSVSGMAEVLAHEIKNPLSGIRGAAQLLESSVDEGNRALTGLIRDEVDRVAALIDRMEGFTDTRPIELAPQNIHAILDHARGVALQGFAKGYRVREVYDPSLPPVFGNRDALIQVFINLMKNAVEAMRENGGETITLTTAYRHGVSMVKQGSDQRLSLPIEICVIDEGPGAPPEIAEHLFDPFVTTKKSGSGLGLALVDKLVADQGGIIEYARETSPPRTKFRVLLPRAENKP